MQRREAGAGRLRAVTMRRFDRIPVPCPPLRFPQEALEALTEHRALHRNDAITKGLLPSAGLWSVACDGLARRHVLVMVCWECWLPR